MLLCEVLLDHVPTKGGACTHKEEEEMQRIAIILTVGNEESVKFWFDVPVVPKVGESVFLPYEDEESGELRGEVRSVHHYIGDNPYITVYLSIHRAHSGGIFDDDPYPQWQGEKDGPRD